MRARATGAAAVRRRELQGQATMEEIGRYRRRRSAAVTRRTDFGRGPGWPRDLRIDGRIAARIRARQALAAGPGLRREGRTGIERRAAAAVVRLDPRAALRTLQAGDDPLAAASRAPRARRRAGEA